MLEPLRRSFLVPMLATLAIGIATFIAFVAASTTLEELAFLRRLPRATLAAPVKGPALYRGRAFGPDDLVSPTKQRAAAVWWWVTTGGSKSRKVTCVGGDSKNLELRDGDVKMPYRALAEGGEVIGRQSAWSARRVIDLGARKQYESSTQPAGCAKGSSPTYVEHTLEPGAEVEVVACYQNGALYACETPLQTVLSAPTLEEHRKRRADRAYLPFMIAGIVWTMAVGNAFIASMLAHKRALQPLRPRGSV